MISYTWYKIILTYCDMSSLLCSVVVHMYSTEYMHYYSLGRVDELICSCTLEGITLIQETFYWRCIVLIAVN